MKTTPIQMTALAVALAAAFPALAQTAATPTTLTPVIVTANGIPTRDSDATYASEVHDRAAIEASGAMSLFDYLAKNTSLNAIPNFGNKNQPALDMRGYGTENGYQNLVVVVDGYRLNNIDMSPAYLGGVPIDSIESIEISKGSGSVAFGDGAMSGVIQIRTRARNGASISAMTGSRGAQDININAGLSREFFDLAVSASNSKQASLSSPDTRGHRDGSDNRAERVDLTLKPVTGLKLFLGGSNAHTDTRFVNPLSPAQFAADPGQNGSVNGDPVYKQQIYESGFWRVGAEYEITPGLTARYMHNEEDKTSNYVTDGYRYDYNYAGDDASLSYRSQSFDLAVGVQQSNGSRYSPLGATPENTMNKDSRALYVQGRYRVGQWSLSAGARREKVDYKYDPTIGGNENSDHKLNAWDLGANYRFSEQLSGFVNLNQAFQAPDVDRFFSYDFLAGTYVFNQLIDPAKSKTLTVGVNHDTLTNRLRVATFYSKLTDEIYYDPFAFSNSNIDKSHKYGLEVSDRWQILDKLALSVAYTYTRSIIDQEDAGAGAYDGKEIPGVPRHGVTLGANWQAWAGGSINLTHTWRDSSYAISNFSNDNSFRQSPYNSTSLSIRHRWKKIEGFVGIDNLFDQQNGVYVYRDWSATMPLAVYPVDFRRTARVGIKVDLF